MKIILPDNMRPYVWSYRESLMQQICGYFRAYWPICLPITLFALYAAWGMGLFWGSLLVGLYILLAASFWWGVHTAIVTDKGYATPVYYGFDEKYLYVADALHTACLKWNRLGKVKENTHEIQLLNGVSVPKSIWTEAELQAMDGYRHAGTQTPGGAADSGTPASASQDFPSGPDSAESNGTRSFTLTRKDILTAYYLLHGKRCLFIMAVYLLVTYVLQFDMSYVSGPLLAGCIAVAATAYRGFYMPYVRTAALTTPRYYSFDDDYLYLQSARGISCAAWEAYTGFVESRTVFILMPNIEVLPKIHWNAEEVERLRHLLQSKAGAKTRPPQPLYPPPEQQCNIGMDA